MTSRFSRLRLGAVVALALFTLAGPTNADVPVDGNALVAQGRAALAREEGVTAQLKFDQAIATGVPLDTVRHLLANAYVLQGNADRVRDLVPPDKVPPRFAAYAARMRAAVADTRSNAIAELEQAVQLAPDDTLAWSDLARQRHDSGDIAGALDAAERAVALDASNTDALVLSGILFRDRYGYAAAIPWFDRALAAQPRHVVAMLERAAVLGELGRARDCLAATRAALAVSPRDPRAFYLQAVLAARAHEWALARSLLYRVGRRLGDAPGQRLLAGAVEVAQGNGEQAIVELRPLVARQPANFVARKLLGTAYFSTGDFHAAIDVLMPLAERPDADTYTLTIVGRSHERLGDRSTAAVWLDRASQPSKGPAASLNRRGGGDTRSGDPGVVAFAGDVLGASGQWTAASDAYRKAANLAFSDTTALRLIDALRRIGDGAAANSVLDVYRTQHPQSAAALSLASDVALSNSQWRSAATQLSAVRAQSGDRDATLLNNLGWAALGDKRTADALDFGRDAYRLLPNSAPVAASYGWFAYNAGDTVSAVPLLEKAVAMAPDIPAYRGWLAKARSGR